MKRGKTPVRGIRIDTETWQAAQRAADERNEDLPDVIRAFLKRYAKTAPKTAGEEDR
jgi:antitoxin component of RelBE/YafQ-DinJ toxin-antitoxin module